MCVDLWPDVCLYPDDLRWTENEVMRQKGKHTKHRREHTRRETQTDYHTNTHTQTWIQQIPYVVENFKPQTINNHRW